MRRSSCQIPFINVLVLFLGIIGMYSLDAQSLDYQSIVHSEYSSDQKSGSSAHEYHVDHGYFDDRLGLHFIYVQDYVDNLPVFNNVTALVINEEGKTVTKGNLPIVYKKSRTLKGNLSAINAVTIALRHKDVKANLSSSNYKSSSLRIEIEDALISEEKINGKKIYYPVKGQLREAWAVSFYIDDKNEWWEIIVDATHKTILKEYPWTMTCFKSHDHTEEHHSCEGTHDRESRFQVVSCDSTYRVYDLPLSNPDEGAQSLVTTPWDLAPLASPQGWHDTTTLTGNNIIAYEDADANNNPGMTVDGGVELCFDAMIDTSDSPFDYVDGALVNLFYINNKIHDIIYNYGFDEAAGNFQKVNYNSDQGKDGDPVLAEGQDGSGLNNANFSSPPDGFSGRMQMYNWVISPLQVEAAINNGDEIINLNTVQASFGPRSGSVNGDLIAADPLLACNPLSNAVDINGKIALIKRGDCSFATKVLHAQAAGAVAVIVCQNDSSQNLFAMSADTTAEILIPAVMISVAQCNQLMDGLDTTTVSILMDLPDYRDSDLDNGIIIHEYAHGISTRLTGGPNNSSCLDNEEQMGEGWSDWYGLMLTMKPTDIASHSRGIGTYVVNDPSDGDGIRRFPYSTDMNVNPLSYLDLPTSFGVHQVGEVWATMLWEMTWSLIDQYGFDVDLYSGTGGNNIALHLVTTALKLQPCSPGFVDGRDAILEANQLLYQGKHQCLIWEAFAKRGLGYSASQGSANSRVDGQPATDLPPLCSQTFSMTRMIESNVIRPNDTLTIDVQLNSVLSGASAQLDFNDSISSVLDVVTNLSSDGSYTSPLFNYQNPTFGPSSQVGLTYDIHIIDSSRLSALQFLEDFENGALSWSASPNGWELKDTSFMDGQYVAFANDTMGDQNHFLFFPAVELTNDRIFYFQHTYDIEANWDGGFVEVSYAGDPTWYDMGEFMIEGGYDGRLIDSSNPFIANREGFTGSSSGLKETFVDLSFFTGTSIEIRFRYGSDAFVYGSGWHIDNVALLSPGYADLMAETSYLGETLRDTARVLLIPECPPCINDLPCVDDNLLISSIDLPSYKSRQSISIDSAMMLSSTSVMKAVDSLLILPETSIEQGFQLEVLMEDCGKE